MKITVSDGEPWEIRLYEGSGEPAAAVSRPAGRVPARLRPLPPSLLAAFQKATAAPAPTVAPTPVPTRKP